MRKTLFFLALAGISSYGFWDIYQKYHHAPNLSELPHLNMSPKHPVVVIDNDVTKMLKREAPTMQADVINKVNTALGCAKQEQLPHQSILTVIDYSLPSNQKRLWVFDLNTQQLLYHTYVAHGIRSGADFTTFFSNQFNSKASSIGLYKTKMNYLGREGTSLRLQGLERGINDNAEGRSIVMHGAFYVEEAFIKKYGRAGRSWGCPALPSSLTKNIIQTIKDDNLMVVYYPSEQWVMQSKYLNCNPYTPLPSNGTLLRKPVLDEPVREAVFFVSHANKHYATETTPVLAVSADYYIQRFKQKAPLERMLRRRINQMEYVALNQNELATLAQQTTPLDLQALNFVLPTLTNNHGYVQTVMKPVFYGKIIGLNINNGYRVLLENQQEVVLQPNNRFIRWLGL